MLCKLCRRSILAQLRPRQIRCLTTAPSTPTAATAQPPSVQGSTTPAISSMTPGASQPFSTPFFPSTSTAKTGSAGGVKESKKVKLQGSIAGGQELRGLGYLKAKPVIQAKEDDEYPDWLWKLTDDAKRADGKSAVDLTALTKKQRAKYDRKQAKLTKDIPKPIPVHEQSMDLTGPGDEADVSLQRRQAITKSSRLARRKNIREDNFLRGM